MPFEQLALLFLENQSFAEALLPSASCLKQSRLELLVELQAVQHRLETFRQDLYDLSRGSIAQQHTRHDLMRLVMQMLDALREEINSFTTAPYDG